MVSGVNDAQIIRVPFRKVASFFVIVHEIFLDYCS